MKTSTRALRTDEPASAQLGTLAAQGATGALSTESGIVYLAAGHVVHVESAVTPDLGDLLTHSGALAPDGWWEAIDQAGRRCRVGRQLVDSGHLAAGALELCHLGALFDAAYFVLAHDGPALRFRPGAAHWLGAVRSVPVDTVLRESRRRRELLHRIWPEPAVDRAPLARMPGSEAADLPTRRGRTLAQVDGVRTAAQIATALACRTFHTLVELRRLAAAGLVAPVAPLIPGSSSNPSPAPASAPATVSAEPGPAPRPMASDEPDTALLRRLLHALEAL
ncbi:hypothetical protein OR263_14320 [Streptomyces sp. NEAU-H22]|uniref:hypothetical protein n=1 Tax=unclassified Streptomyces TaxID=2593676 RepID=UPI00225030EB|nr:MULTISPECIES: hypothetical protein [unclassified Streptomyces]MCX3287866.1 hypothetical protein [Streptomyces sp. NEAU-H22]WMD06141.1 hypothetical protein Q7C01_17800 [Streptomyces sp. FXY-T5]